MSAIAEAEPRQGPHATRFAALIVAIVVCLAVLVAPAAHADGDPSKDVIRELNVNYELDARGQLHVTESFEWDFGERNGLGFYRTLVQRMGYEPDRSQERVFEYRDFEVHSPSGAPAEVWIDNAQGNELRLSIGAPDGSSDTRTGIQSYVLSYTVLGAINPIRGQQGVPDQDELYWNVFSDSPNQVDRVTVRVVGPATVVDVACYQGRSGSRTACDDFTADGSSALFAARDLARRDGLTIMVAFPAGTFSEPGPILVDRPFGSGTADIVRTSWPILTGIWAALLGVLGVARARFGRDRAYLGLAPDVLPAPGERYQQARLGAEPPITARVVPPEGLRPAEAIVISDEATSTKAFTATMIDLAVRGYFTIEPKDTLSSDELADWQLTLKPDAPPRSQLMDYEQTLMSSLFDGRSTVRISTLRGKFQPQLEKFDKALTAHADQQAWFTREGLAWGRATFPGVITFSVGLLGILAVVLVVFFEGRTGLLPLLIAGIVAGVSLLIVWLATAKAAHARNGRGRAHYEQIRGFRDHLSSVEGHQLRWETGHDIFSDYLPWAVGFGLTGRWVGLFERLAEQGDYDISPTWYMWSGMGHRRRVSSIGESVKGLETTGISALSYTPGSSGSSGSFGGGGGFSGGGGGGGSFGGR